MIIMEIQKLISKLKPYSKEEILFDTWKDKIFFFLESCEFSDMTFTETCITPVKICNLLY